MNVEAYNLIIDHLQPLFDHEGLKPVDTENGSYFINKDRAVKITFDEGKKVFELMQCGVSEGQPDEGWKSLSSYLFPDDYTLKDAKSVANEFDDTMRDALGIKAQSSSVNVKAIPTARKATNEYNIDTLTAKFLQVFPQYKTTYGEYVTENGTFLYVKFFTEIGSPLLLELLEKNDKKRIEKYLDMLNTHYCLGDKTVRSVVSTVILAETLKGKKDLIERAKTYMAEMPYLSRCMDFSITVI